MFFKKKNPTKIHLEEEEEIKVEKVSSASKIFFDEVLNNDEATAHYVDKLKEGSPVCLNFEKIDVVSANKVLAFMIGATYALGGKTLEIRNKIYLFVLKDQLEDGSISNWLLQYKE